MQRYLAQTLAGLMMLASAYAQTSAESQTSTAASQSTSVSANRSGAQADSSASAKGAQSTKISRNGQAQAASASRLDSGSTVHAALTKPVDARKNKPGDEVVAKTTQDVKSNGQVVIPRGSKIVGHVTEAKARAKGQEDSSLGLMFDHAILKNGTTVPVSFAVQAIGNSYTAGQAQAQGDSLSSAAGSAGMASSSVGRSSGGGLVGGVGSTVGAATNTAAGATGSLTGATQVGSVAPAPLSATSQGVVGMPNLSLVSSTTNSASSTITSNKSNVHLDSGTEMILKANQ
jgi:hypothetical protein